MNREKFYRLTKGNGMILGEYVIWNKRHRKSIYCIPTDTTYIFKTLDELMAFKIKGKTLGEIVDEIDDIRHVIS